MFEERVGEWLRRVELSPGSERQSAIVEAAMAMRTELTPWQCLSVVQLAHAVDDPDAFDLVRSAVSDRDGTFGCAIDDLETRLIAGLVVAALLELDSEHATVTAHGVLSAQWSGLESTVQDLPGLAATALVRRSEELRSREGFSITTDLTGASKAIPSFPADDGPTTHNEVAPLAAAQAKALETVKRSIDQAAARIRSRLAASDEELDVLWWAFSDYSTLEGSPWSRVSGPRRALVVARELFELLRFAVEPPSARAILSRLLGSAASETVALAVAVDDLCASSVDLQRHDGHRLLPILSSVGECGDLQGKAAWKDSVARWGVDADRGSSQLDLAVQTVRELLVSKNLG